MTEVVRINAGCGPNPTIGWKNYDNSFSIILARRRELEAVLKAFGFINRQNVEFIEFVRNNDIEYADVSRHIPVADKSVDLKNLKPDAEYEFEVSAVSSADVESPHAYISVTLEKSDSGLEKK